MGGVEASEAAGTTADPARPRLKVAVVLWEPESHLMTLYNCGDSKCKSIFLFFCLTN